MINRCAFYGLWLFLLVLPCLDRPVLAQIPQEHDYQVTLRNYLATLTLEDLDVALSPLVYEDSFLTSMDELHATWILLENYGRRPTLDMTGLRVASLHFTLSEIERNGQVYMRVGRNSGFMDPINTAWWATWDYAGNPHFNSSAVKMRAFVAAAVDMMMTDQDLETSTSHQRSDFVGGYLTKFGYVYYVVKDILPEDVQAAYETGLLKIFEHLESYYPYGSGGADMEAFQLAGLWYTAEAIGSEDLRTRARDRARFVLDQIMVTDGHHHHHGLQGIDLSYEGINQHFLSWAALLYDDSVITDFVQKSARLKAYQTLPEPSGHYYSPSHFNTGTANGAANDQWHSYQRDHAMAMLSDEAKYLIWTGRVLPGWYRQGVPAEQEMKSDIHDSLLKRNTDTDDQQGWAWVIQSEKEPAIWQPEHWMDGLAAAAIMYREGFYDELLSLQSANDSYTRPPFLREKNFIDPFGDAFVIAKFDTYGAIIHTGKTVPAWASGVPGLSGGGLSAFWTKETGSVWLGRSRGTQNSDADQWNGEQGWDTWAVHAISGVNSSGQPFSSARNRSPVTSKEIEGSSVATINVNGSIGQHDEGRSAPDGAITGVVSYERTFSMDESGLSITSTLESDGTDEVEQLWEMIPLFLSDTDQNVQDAALQFYSNGLWYLATSAVHEEVTVIRTTRFDKSIDIVFEEPQRVKLSSNRWASGQVSSQVQNVMVDLLDNKTGMGTMPAYTSVSYLIKPADVYSTGDVSGDGVVSAYDAAAVLQHITEYKLLDQAGSIAADVSGDGTVTAFDASLILQYMVGLIDCMPAEEACQ